MTPPLPQLSGDITLAVFTHRSLRSGQQNEPFGDGERLAVLGQYVLRMVVTEVLFNKKPLLVATELETELDSNLSDESYEQWISHYGLRIRVICPQNVKSELEEPSETRQLFHAVVGAVHVEHGYASVRAWIGQLVDPSFDVPPTNNGAGGSSQGAQAYPPPPASSPPPLPHNPLAPTTPTASFLAKFNELANQKRVPIEWLEESSGPAHLKIWTVQCKANGAVMGQGSGKDKKQARAEAARQAYQAMGWGGAAQGPYNCVLRITA
ncbi:hypothetical protein BC834DRAFT_441831 [Gloeopeniophorella convolvens]|nr:hypothetical protein BC834DRAFT_441831 [Gloeopeniophorella convolvens]